MSLTDIHAQMQLQAQSNAAEQAWQARFISQITFAQQLIELHPTEKDSWGKLLLQASECCTATLARGEGLGSAVRAAEQILAPIGETAKSYTVHCVGHAHIDMNWMWNWPETVLLTHDTFVTIDKLMDEFPFFHFSQSQGEVYNIVKEFFPELYQRIKARVREGRWEVTANHWVEGEKNLASGESICRQILHAKDFMRDEFDFTNDNAVVDWEPDTFGHPHSLPGLITSAGMRYYYFCRAGKGPHLFWWQGKDGARVLAFDDLRKWYHCKIIPENILNFVADFARETGLRDYLMVYGVGDHGGGPTRLDLRNGAWMSQWPIFPTLKFGSAADFFRTVEPHAAHLPVVDDELNPTLEGCYTSQSAIKHANRRSEMLLVETETIALLEQGLFGAKYPKDKIRECWQIALFNQFHDILPGSGIHATYEHALGKYQQLLAGTSAIKTVALRKLAAQVNTAPYPCGGISSSGAPRAGQGIGAGMGDIPVDGAVSRLGTGGDCCDPFVILNANCWPRSEVITVRLWNRDYPDNNIIVLDDAGNRFPAQYLNKNNYWWTHHDYREFAFPVKNVSACGYRSYRLVHQPAVPEVTSGCSAQVTGLGNTGIEAIPSYPGIVGGKLENDFLLLEIDSKTGAISRLFDKRSGRELVPPGEAFALLEYQLERPHGMTAWKIDQTIETAMVMDHAILDVVYNGPYLATLSAKSKWRSSSFEIEFSLQAGSPQLAIKISVDWQEAGSAQRGVPTLRMAFPLLAYVSQTRFSAPNGDITRPANGREVPAQQWVDFSGTHRVDNATVGILLLNEDKYGFSADEHTLRVSLLRSSYDPDPLPESGQHVINLAICPHDGSLTAGAATRAGLDYNQPLNIITAGEHDGELPSAGGFVELLTDNVQLSGLKPAEDGSGLIVRLYESDGIPVTARLRLHKTFCPANSPALEVSILEEPLEKNSAIMVDDILQVNISPYSTVTVKILK